MLMSMLLYSTVMLMAYSASIDRQGDFTKKLLADKIFYQKGKPTGNASICNKSGEKSGNGNPPIKLVSVTSQLS